MKLGFPRGITSAGAVVAVAAAISGCAGQPTTFQPFTPMDLNSKVQGGKYRQQVDDFLVIMDASSSMDERHDGKGVPEFREAKKLIVEKEILNRMNQTIPNLTLGAGLRTFGFGPCSGWKHTNLEYGMTNYSQSAFKGGIDRVDCASGGSPMNKALEAAAGDLGSSQGKVAVILISDGYQLDGDPIPAVQTLKNRLGDRLCLHTIWVGNENEIAGKALLAQMPLVARCGSTHNVGEIASSAGMAGFVEKVFLEKAPEKCPGTPPGVPVDEEGCPLDSDGDGVFDYQDQCPDTPKGATVNKVGCWAYTDLKFDFDKAVIKPEGYPMLNEAVGILKRNPDLQRVEIQGHTDNVGSAAYNLKLSERRARAVKQYLVDHGIAAHRLTTRGFGLTAPTASNDTEEGRAENRRVEFKVLIRK